MVSNELVINANSGNATFEVTAVVRLLGFKSDLFISVLNTILFCLVMNGIIWCGCFEGPIGTSRVILKLMGILKLSFLHIS